MEANDSNGNQESADSAREMFGVDYDPTDPAEIRKRLAHVPENPSEVADKLADAVAETIAVENEQAFKLMASSPVTQSPFNFKPEEFSVWEAGEYAEKYNDEATLKVTQGMALREEDEFLYGNVGEIDGHTFNGVETRLEGKVIEKLDSFAFGVFPE